VDEIDQDGDFQAAFAGVAADGGDLLLVPVHEEDPLADPLRVTAVGLIECLPDHRGDVLGDRGGYPLVPRGRAGTGLAAVGRGGDVLRLAGRGGEIYTNDNVKLIITVTASDIQRGR